MAPIPNPNPTYTVQIGGGERQPFRPNITDSLVTVELLLTLFEHGVSFAALDVWEGHHYHNVKIWIKRDV